MRHAASTAPRCVAGVSPVPRLPPPAPSHSPTTHTTVTLPFWPFAIWNVNQSVKFHIEWRRSSLTNEADRGELHNWAAARRHSGTNTPQIHVHTHIHTGIYLWIHSLTFQCANEEDEGHQMEAGKHFAGSVCVQSLQSNKSLQRERGKYRVSEWVIER